MYHARMMLGSTSPYSASPSIQLLLARLTLLSSSTSWLPDLWSQKRTLFLLNFWPAWSSFLFLAVLLVHVKSKTRHKLGNLTDLRYLLVFEGLNHWVRVHADIVAGRVSTDLRTAFFESFESSSHAARNSDSVSASDGPQHRVSLQCCFLREFASWSQSYEQSNHWVRVHADIVAGRVSTEASAELKNEVFPFMKSDWIGKVARSDPLICSLGNLAMKRNIGNKPMRRYNVSSVMRLSARALLELRELQEIEDGFWGIELSV